MISVLAKRPVAFRVPLMENGEVAQWLLFESEERANEVAEISGVDYQGLYVRDGSTVTLTEREAVEAAIDRMGWPEIHAFQDELRKGQDVFEDAGGFMMRAIRRLFGLPSSRPEVVNYQKAAKAMVEAGSRP